MRLKGPAAILLLITSGVLAACQPKEEPFVPSGTLITSTRATSQSVINEDDENLTTEEILAGQNVNPAAQ